MKLILEGYIERERELGWEPETNNKELIVKSSVIGESHVVLEIDGATVTVNVYDLRKALLAF